MATLRRALPRGPALHTVFRPPATLPRRHVHIRATPATTALDPPLDLSSATQTIPKLSGAGPFPARVLFEVLGAPYSLLSVSLPASTALFSRRGALVGVNGAVDNAVSTLTTLSPLLRLPARMPFLYQRTMSTSPLTLLLASNDVNTTFGVVELDGKADWRVTQPRAVLAWTGYSLGVAPRITRRLGVNTHLTGRGLVALIGRGQLYQLTLQPGESMLLHPSALLAYSETSSTEPTPYHLPPSTSSPLRTQIPNLTSGLRTQLLRIRWIRTLTESPIWKNTTHALGTVREWLARVLGAHRYFVRLHGPATVLVQSRTAKRIVDVLRREEVQEFADVRGPAKNTGTGGEKEVGVGLLEDRVEESARTVREIRRRLNPGTLKRVTVSEKGVEFQDSDFSEFRR